ncbi:MAG: TonB-dependent receptor family protein [Gemmatimonadales bacterium]
MPGLDLPHRSVRTAFGVLLLLGLLALSAPRAGAQQPASSDTTRRDTTRVTRLPDINVTVTRSTEPLERVPYATGVLNRGDLQRGQQTIGLDEALNNLPGVVVSNRYNFSLDQRISIRGAGSRSNFGVRGLKILLDGVPQTLPDGQSQLTNVEFADIARAEGLRGSSSSLYGNASGGVISFQSEPAAAAPFAQRVRVQGGTGKEGNDDFYKWQSWSSGRLGNASGTLSLSQFKADGFRQHSAGEVRQLNAGIDYVFSGSTIGTLRFSAADDPRAENPGALTLAEYLANPDSAAANNIARGADKDVQQQQLSLGARHFDQAGNEYTVTVFGLLRDLKNPLAAPPPNGFGPTIGTYVDIGRVVGGARASAAYRLGSGPRAPRLTAGADLQRMRDNRRNFVSVSGAPTDSVVIDQREKITEFGPFAQLSWTPDQHVLVSGGARYDWVRFDVLDHHLSDGVDNSGVRTNAAFSGNVGASWSEGEEFVPYVNLSTSFETPTTTELVNQPNGTGGFNDQLKPQRAVTYEVGARGRVSPWVSYSAAFFIGRITDAIVQQQEVGGRAFFVNAGKTHNDGAEIGLSLTPVTGLTLNGAYTFAHYRFATGDSLDGNRLPGVPDHFWRLGLRTSLPGGIYVDADHTLSSSLAADDANTIVVDSWGAGVTNLRVGWTGTVGTMQLSPFVGFNNLWDRRYIGSVTVNGVGGRVLEPAPGRVVYIGTEIGYRTAAQP